MVSMNIVNFLGEKLRIILTLYPEHPTELDVQPHASATRSQDLRHRIEQNDFLAVIDT